MKMEAKYGEMDKWKYGHEIGDMDAWRHGHMAAPTWRHGNIILGNSYVYDKKSNG
jgi:hypothetical protein